ncbi:MAG: thioredoxin-disulfide reductase [Bacteroidales bacterium]|nr:thioredoxin-disulfide reductase [Bacteroidales bacterium]MBN2757564.1 thioredoxin-disulfide reductase [Bacteroidales bacterium]
MEENKYDVIIIGGGPAGLTAGIYLSRAKVKTLILDSGTIGGQVVLTHEIANYPGIESISGYQLAKNMRKQAKKFGCEIRSNIKITSLVLNTDIKEVTVNDLEKYISDAVILTTGGKSRPLNVPGEKEFAGKGISYCATCDGDFFQDKEIIVVGGGNSALEEAVSLTQYASKVTIVHQFDNFQAYPHAIDEAKKNPKINYIMESEIIEFFGDESLKKVKIEHQRTHEITELNIDGVFIFIGYVPQTQMFEGLVDLNNRGEIVVDENLQTNIKGVFAAGDSIAKKYRQITTAVSDGTIAALNAIEFVNSL